MSEFNRDEMAAWYSKRHLKTDPEILSVHFNSAGTAQDGRQFLKVIDAAVVGFPKYA